MVVVRQYDRGIRLTVFPPVTLDGSVLPPFLVNPIPPPGAGLPALPQIHVRFTVDKSLTPEPQRATITVWNLAKTTRDTISGAAKRVVDWIPGGVSTPIETIDGRIFAADPTIVDTIGGLAHARLEAGYGAALSVLFQGSVAPVINRRSGTDWITTMQAGDSELGLTQAVAGKSFEPGTPASAVLVYLAKTLGLTVAPTPSIATLATCILENGIVAEGRAREGLADLLGAADLDWWVEDGVLWVLGPGEFVPGIPILTSSEDLPGMHRLLEAPMRTDDNGVVVKMRLAPEVSPGKRLVIAASELAGEYRVEHVTHAGDNRSGPFHSTAICRTQNPLGL